MVSLLWKACSEGDLQNVQELLNDATTVDIEIKDHTGATPLIEAVKNGYIEIVRALLDKGADPMNASSQGRPEQYTSDPVVLELLNFAQNKTISGIPAHEPVYTPESNDGQDKRYGYGSQPPVMYPYYPSLNSVSPPHDGAAYYPHPPAPQNGAENSPTGSVNNGNLPPPEVARLIPCRYFPACRYGATCLFAHPQTPYYQGPVPPPAQYSAPYDPMSVHPYPPSYYPQHSFQPPPNPPHMAPLPSPVVPHPGHTRSSSEAVLPVQAPSFSPNGVHPTVPYGPMSPSAYSHPGHPPVPMSISPLPPLPPQAALPTHSPSNMYNVPAPIPPFVQHDGTVQYPVPQPTHPNMGLPDVNGDTNSPVNPQPDILGPHHPQHRDGLSHHRRGGARRGSFGGRKPPCLFFPAGRCKNGDDCRFPHVLVDGSGTHHQSYFSGRNGRPRHPNGNGFAAINEKLAGMTIQDDHAHQEDAGHSPSDSTRGPRYPNGHKNTYQPNGVRPDKRPPTTKQRVPNADEFPLLAGSVTPPSRNPGTNGVVLNGNGPTAAQVLQAPPPLRKDSSKESTPRGTTPDIGNPACIKVEPNGIVPPPPTHDYQNNKLPVSFAAAAASEVS